ncbi:MAG: tRNA 2-thiouridine(34) synthase MnmA [Woeseiaceae bacterium]|nr:tRNA 2-thiouridine(34) synthase MnmA [Woeseiaceae bacterium]
MTRQPATDLIGVRVVVGLSGGVDSAVAALLLRERGADVHALHMTNWEDDDVYCTAAEDLQDARRVADDLGIPLHHVNFSREYRQKVFDHFLGEYRAGRTPNPDVLCNREIKFGAFRAHARRLGAERVATGHYARRSGTKDAVQLLKGRDPDKDQSYFLHAVSADALSDALFPLGDMLKSDVRAMARDHGLATQDKKDSTGICFIGERPFREFLSQFLPPSGGPIVTPDGVELGRHDGLAYYTLGQRQGLGIGGRADSGDAPWYVAGKDRDANALIVVQGEHPLLYSEAIDVRQAHWIGEPPDLAGDAFNCAVKLRYRQPDQACRIERHADDTLRVRFERQQRAVTPGQYAVFYDGERCLGGGVIDCIVRESSADARPAARFRAAG